MIFISLTVHLMKSPLWVSSGAACMRYWHDL